MRFLRYLSLLAAVLAVTVVAPAAHAQSTTSGVATSSGIGWNDAVQTYTLTQAPNVVCVDNSATIGTPGYSTLLISVSGTYSGTISWFGSGDAFSTWKPLPAIPQLNQVNGASTAGPMAVGTSTNGTWLAQVAGFSGACAYFSTYTAGSATISLRASRGGRDGTMPSPVQGFPLQPPVQVSLPGPFGFGSAATSQFGPNAVVPRVSVTNDQDIVQHYRCAASFTPTATGAVTMVTMAGSANKTVHITKIVLSSHATAETTFWLALQRTSVLGAGGTAVTPTVATTDSRGTGLGASAVCTHYTSTLKAAGTAVGGPLTEQEFTSNTVTTSTIFTPYQIVWPEGSLPGPNIVLRGASDFLELQNVNGGNLGAATILEYAIDWFETTGD